MSRMSGDVYLVTNEVIAWSEFRNGVSTQAQFCTAAYAATREPRWPPLKLDLWTTVVLTNIIIM
eukprot:1195086-Prorocentrum_minimum.AAC.7